MREVCDDAYVLRARAYGDKRHLITLLSRDHGLVRVMWEGRTPYDMGTCVWAAYAPQGGKIPLARLERTETPYPSLAVTKTLMPEASRSLAALYEVCHLLPRVLAQGHPYPPLFEALARLMASARKADFAQAHMVFRFFLLKTLGYGIDFSHTWSQGLRLFCQKTGMFCAQETQDTLKVPSFFATFMPEASLALPVPLSEDALYKATIIADRCCQAYLSVDEGLIIRT
ncbi:DNA repair protein RecO [Candidatus Hepatobacter penaei]|uniref:DNA repair protein RecO n=1 Tax=Candidatus Hepatobacter penaei TaxID=1274402 RepID=UPI0004F3CA15|nr:recombination protein O N-terminal domain-containing protein [Candidatus Hepatobacter penaei]